jgi:hypothetical protein
MDTDWAVLVGDERKAGMCSPVAATSGHVVEPACGARGASSIHDHLGDDRFTISGCVGAIGIPLS